MTSTPAAPAIRIAVLNPSTVVSDAEVQAVLPALQTQVSRDFASAWGTDAQLRFVPKSERPAAAEWWLAVLDDSDQAGALGYHDVTQDGLPLGKVFAKTDKQYGESWTCTASHELLEMLADPAINLTVFEQEAHGGRLYAMEVCDACEAEDFAYEIDGVLVSDFVYPAWFQSFRKAHGTRFDHMGHIGKPFELIKGGYIGVYDVTQGNGWRQITADRENFRARAPVGSRRERRAIPPAQRLRSRVFE